MSHINIFDLYSPTGLDEQWTVTDRMNHHGTFRFIPHPVTCLPIEDSQSAEIGVERGVVG